MKIFPRLLAALVAALPLSAAPTVVAGKVYDVGKLIYSGDAAAKTGISTDDRSMCWAAAGANLLQHWQDFYYQHRDQGRDVPNGLAAPLDVHPAGTAYLAVYREFLQSWTNGSGLNPDAFTWWLQGTQLMQHGAASAELLHIAVQNGRNPGGYYRNLFTEPTRWVPGQNGPCGCMVDYGTTPGSDLQYAPRTLAELQSILDTMLQQGGQAGVLAFMNQEPGADGKWHMRGGHAVSCWGYECDAAGKLCALYLTDSDDGMLSAFRVNAAEENGAVTLYSLDPASNYSRGDSRRLVFCALSHINTPAAAACPNRPADTLPQHGLVVCNTQLTEPLRCENLCIRADERLGQTIFTTCAPLQTVGRCFISHGALASLNACGEGDFSFGEFLNGGQCRIAHAKALNIRSRELHNGGYIDLDSVGEVQLDTCINSGCITLQRSSLRVGEMRVEPAENAGFAAFGKGVIRRQSICGMQGSAQLRHARLSAPALQLRNVHLSGRCRIETSEGVTLEQVNFTLPLPLPLQTDESGALDVDCRDLIVGGAQGELCIGFGAGELAYLRQQGVRRVRFLFAPDMRARLIPARGLQLQQDGSFIICP